MKGRAVLLVLSVLVAAVGTGLIYAYVRGADSRALGTQQLVKVIVADADIAQGSLVRDGLKTTIAEYAAGAVPQEALTLPNGTQTLEDLAAAGATTRLDIKRGDPLQAGYFTKSAASTTSSENTTNVSIQVEVEGAAAGVGLLEVGRPTIVLVTIKGKTPKTAILLPQATVVSLNGVSGTQDAASGTSGRTQAPEGGQGTVGLSIPLKDVKKVVLAQTYADKLPLYFGLPGSRTNGTQEVQLPELQRAVAE